MNISILCRELVGKEYEQAMSEDSKIFLYVVGGVFSVFAFTFLYLTVFDLRRGRTGLLMTVLACGVVYGIVYHQMLAIVFSILFSAAWIVGSMYRLLDSSETSRAEDNLDKGH
jgi:hypothetical protein